MNTCKEPKEQEIESKLNSSPKETEAKKRFRLVKLEERIAPSGGGGPTKHHCYTRGCW